MKLRKIKFLFSALALVICGCDNANNDAKPNKLEASINELKLLVNTERDLNDLLSFNVNNDKINYSTNEKDIFTLNDSTIKTNQLGSSTITANAYEDLKTDINVKVIQTYPVILHEGSGYSITDLSSVYESGNDVSFNINLLDNTKAINEVKANDIVLNTSNGTTYSFTMPNEQVVIKVSLKDIIKATSVSLDKNNLELNVGEEDAKLVSNVLPIDTTDFATWSIVEGNDIISINPNKNELSIHAIKQGTAKVKVSYNDNVSDECLIVVKDPNVAAIVGVQNVIDLDINNTFTLTPSLNKGSGSFTYKSSDDGIAKVDSNGQVSGVSYGSTTITITNNENNEVTKTINVEVCNHGSINNPITINQAMEIADKVCLSSEDYTTSMIYTKGTAIQNSSSDGVFNLRSDFDILKVSNANYEADVATVAQNDEVLIKGYLTKVDKNYIMCRDVEIISNTRGYSLITFIKYSNASFKVDTLDNTDTYSVLNGAAFPFTVTANEGYEIESVKINGNKIDGNNGSYSFIVAGDADIEINAIASGYTALAKYNINYDLGSRVTAKQIETTDEVFNTFVVDGTDSIINSISQIEYIYGGANGGRSETAWHTENILKFGTTSVNGSMTLQLNKEVNCIKITGYVSDNACKIRVGDSLSSDWSATTLDNKTTLFTCTDMNETTKEIVEANQVSTILIYFESTSSLKIATTNKKPLYITSIEFGVGSQN